MKVWTIAFRYLLTMTLLTGVLYPLAVTGIAKAFMQDRAEGSLVRSGKGFLGSYRIGQKFESPKYFWSRPSAVDYNPQPSGGSNWGPTSADLVNKVAERRSAFQSNGGAEPPQDLLFASGSGLDPDISPAAALFQLDRVAEARGLSAEQKAGLENLVQNSIETRQFGILGDPRVNVLELNLALDQAFPEPTHERSSTPQS